MKERDYADFDAADIEPNWWEFIFKEKQPERRGYHSSFIHKDKLYIFGGKDIGAGHLNNLYMLNLEDQERFIAGESEYMVNPEWELIKTIGKEQPKPICNHTSIIFGDKMYLYGGSCPAMEKPTFFSLDLAGRFKWEVVKA